MSISPFDVVKSLNEKTELEYDIKEYSVFMVNRIMSNNLDTLFFAEAMNRLNNLSTYMQRDFYWHGLPKAKRFGKYNKALAINNTVELIIAKYAVNRKVAEGYYKLMDESALIKLRESMDHGGTHSSS